MTRMTPSEAFVETLVAHGVTTAFGIMGSAFMDAMDSNRRCILGALSCGDYHAPDRHDGYRPRWFPGS